jgi:uncharacterized iron-regulated protein
VQHRLIAEEVERVYPELMTRGTDGRVEGVRYDMLPALLLDEVQKLTQEDKKRAQQIRTLIAQGERKDARIAALEEQNQVLLLVGVGHTRACTR